MCTLTKSHSFYKLFQTYLVGLHFCIYATNELFSNLSNLTNVVCLC